jgi:hypothetical protein
VGVDALRDVKQEDEVLAALSYISDQSSNGAVKNTEKVPLKNLSHFLHTSSSSPVLSPSLLTLHVRFKNNHF